MVRLLRRTPKPPSEVVSAERRWRAAEEAYLTLMRAHRPPALEGELVPGKFLDATVMHQLEQLDQAAEICRADYETACMKHAITPHW